MSYADFVQHILAKAYMRQVLGQEKFDQWSRRYNLAYNRLWNRRIFGR